MPEPDTHVGFAWRAFSDAGSTPAASTKISVAENRTQEDNGSQMLTSIQVQILKRISTEGPTGCDGSAYIGKSKLAVLMGNQFFTDIAGKVVIDFGCGEGADAVEMALKGAKRVIGIDIQEDLLQTARR